MTSIEIPRESHHPLRLEWPPKWLKLLGRMPDAELAEKMGVSLIAVQHERRRRQIAPLHPKIPNIEWTPGMIRILGTDTDRNIATRLRIPVHTVRYQRRNMGIPPYTDTGQYTFEWTGDKIALLGTNFDGIIAKQLGVSRHMVVTKRAQLGIISFSPRQRIRWTNEMAALLGKTTDREIADRYKLKWATVAGERRRRGIPPTHECRRVKPIPKLKPILSLPQGLIMQRYHVGPTTVRRLRQELGVPGVRRRSVKARGKTLSSR